VSFRKMGNSGIGSILTGAAELDVG
jgi:hypothetical protein